MEVRKGGKWRQGSMEIWKRSKGGRREEVGGRRKGKVEEKKEEHPVKLLNISVLIGSL